MESECFASPAPLLCPPFRLLTPLCTMPRLLPARPAYFCFQALSTISVPPTFGRPASSARQSLVKDLDEDPDWNLVQDQLQDLGMVQV